MTTYASADDVAARWRPLTDVEQELADTLAGVASRRVRRRFPIIDARITAGDIDPLEVTDVVAAMVKRAMLAGDGAVTSQQEVAGPFQRNVQYANPMGDLYFTADDLAVLAEAGTTSSVRSIRLTSASTD